MHPVIWTMFWDAVTRKRTCPKCKRGQLVPVDKRQQVFPCKYCGAQMPATGGAKES